MSNFDMMRRRLEWQGGIEQENRMIHDKYRTLQRVLLYSYQACTVSIVQQRDQCLEIDKNGNNPDFRALINPDKVKQDYDDKIISIPYETGFQPGDIFEWRKTDTKWIIYLEEITEDAYFRGEIRRCRHIIKFKDKDGETRYTWAAIRGPVETQIESIQKNQVRIDRPNLSLNILMPLNEYTKSMFDRYSEFLFEGRCWRVQAPDWISMNGVLEVNAEEYYVDRDTDDQENEIKDGLVIQTEVIPSEIQGEQFIQPLIESIYTGPAAGGTWCLKDKVDVKLTVLNDTQVKVLYRARKSQPFTLVWKKDDQIAEKYIYVESLLGEI